MRYEINKILNVLKILIFLPELDRLPVASKKSGDMDETPPELCNSSYNKKKSNKHNTNNAIYMVIFLAKDKFFV